jgi:hypothetical protein
MILKLPEVEDIDSPPQFSALQVFKCWSTQLLSWELSPVNFQSIPCQTIWRVWVGE